MVVHGEDARRPLGIAHTYDPEALGVVADFYKGSNTLIGAKKRIAGLTLRPTDQDLDPWQRAARRRTDAAHRLASLTLRGIFPLVHLP